MAGIASERGKEEGRRARSASTAPRGPTGDRPPARAAERLSRRARERYRRLHERVVAVGGGRLPGRELRRRRRPPQRRGRPRKWATATAAAASLPRSVFGGAGGCGARSSGAMTPPRLAATAATRQWSAVRGRDRRRGVQRRQRVVALARWWARVVFLESFLVDGRRGGRSSSPTVPPRRPAATPSRTTAESVRPPPPRAAQRRAEP